MLFFGAVFMIYFLKLSAGKGFWRNLRETDNALRTVAIDYQKCYLKYQKAEWICSFYTGVKITESFLYSSDISTLRINTSA